MKYILVVVIFFISVNTKFVNAQTKYVCNKTLTDKWREAADSGQYEQAINMLLDSIELRSTKNKHADYWHIGQLYACNNNYSKAIFYLRKSTSVFTILADREWVLYYKGTIAFLNRDKNKLNKCNQKLWATHSGYYEKNACTLKSLAENFELPYKQASTIKCNKES